MRLLVTGCAGQVASSLAERADGRFDLIFAGRPDLDLADPASIERVVAAVSPDIVVSVAAYTAVDQAETERDLAFQVNAEAPAVLAHAAAQAGASIIHVSTDYVFDGTLDRPYRESDPIAPLGVYGASKAAGEEAIRRSAVRHAIVRTAWVYSPFGHSFVRTMLRLAATRDELMVVEDQFGCPTSALGLASGLLTIVERWKTCGDVDCATYHLAGPDEMSWADFARRIFASSARHGGPTAKVIGIPTSAWPTLAARPANSRLDSSIFARTFGYRMPPTAQAIDETVGRILLQS